MTIDEFTRLHLGVLEHAIDGHDALRGGQSP